MVTMTATGLRCNRCGRTFTRPTPRRRAQFKRLHETIGCTRDTDDASRLDPAERADRLRSLATRRDWETIAGIEGCALRSLKDWARRYLFTDIVDSITAYQRASRRRPGTRAAA